MSNSISTLRPPALAGAFYPADPASLERMVSAFLTEPPVEPAAAKAIIAPHAGYIYSGAIAGAAYASVKHLSDRITRVVLLGPAHRWPLYGLATLSADGLATPLGVAPVDRDGREAALSLPDVQIIDAAFDGEHALEVHLPFIQRTFPKAAVTPLLVGACAPQAVEAVLQRLWGGLETMIVVSSDLSHFHDYATACRRDRTTSNALESAEPQALTINDACGCAPISGLLLRARDLDLRVTTRALRNSGDTAGDKHKVVGYGAYTFEQADEARLSDAERRQLLDTAHQALKHAVRHGHPPDVVVEIFPMALRAMRKTFVTLEVAGRLRGCIGSVEPINPLIRDVVENCHRAAMQDPRFGPLTAAELADVTITVSILSHYRPMIFADETDLLRQLRPGMDGLIICDHDHSALFLPKVWDTLPEPWMFLHHLKAKAGFDCDAKIEPFQAFRFTAEIFETQG